MNSVWIALIISTAIDLQINFIVCVIGIIIVLVLLISEYIRMPFQYPEVRYTIDLSGKRQPSYEECVDDWLVKLDGHGRTLVKMYNDTVDEWENNCLAYLRRTWFWKRHKFNKYNIIKQEVTASDYKLFIFEFVRSQTRYRQKNYQKYAYAVDNTEYVLRLSLRQLLDIDDELEEIDYETTRQKYFAKNQRRLLTKELRRKIIERDNYTCQICGKYMPDEVGLHVDHIIPIKKGGKSVESNLQVLCDKCNLHKGRR